MKSIKNLAASFVVAVGLPSVALADWVLLDVDGNAAEMGRGVASEDELIAVLKEFSRDLRFQPLPEAGRNILLLNVTEDVPGFVAYISRNGEAMGYNAASPLTEEQAKGFNIGVPWEWP